MQRTMERKSFHALFLLVLLLAGCGTIVHGSTQDISIKADPPGATVKVDGKQVKAPSTITVARRIDHTVTIEMEGYENQEVKVERSVINWGASILGNILWLLPGGLVDILTGGAFTLEPDAVDVVLKKKSTAAK